jgi:hypothetical protein
LQILVRLCSHTSPAEELARKDDLTLLFSAITSWCPPHNVPWRKSAAEVLMTLSRHGLTPNVVQYIHSTYSNHHICYRNHPQFLCLQAKDASTSALTTCNEFRSSHPLSSWRCLLPFSVSSRIRAKSRKCFLMTSVRAMAMCSSLTFCLSKLELYGGQLSHLFSQDGSWLIRGSGSSSP